MSKTNWEIPAAILAMGIGFGLISWAAAWKDVHSTVVEDCICECVSYE